ncbi:spore germination protein KA [Thalassobacillus devorans]|uniref:Spore germination protein KA n=1 Tax=Thalassobacillus devorans TaxID=279813 RepID=A0ABQ1PEH2_9BACI|nr:spore germination protein [Thalassobacillus devorans]NIK29311.1 spore germination protein KA [Thalassobacillus devorans]GGC95715.1 spore germination protein KA [Thalassobacillus devorans]
MSRFSRRKRQTPEEQTSSKKLDKTLQNNLEQFKQTLGESTDIVIRTFKAGQTGSIDIAVLYTSGLVNDTIVHDFVLDTLMVQIRQTPLDTIEKDNYQLIKDFAMTGGNITDIDTTEKLFNHVLSGDTVVMLDGSSEAMAIDTREWESRSVEEPSTQSVVRGPKEGFTENLRTNTALLRRRIKDPNLWISTKPIGTKSKTDVAVVYLHGVADEKVVKEVTHRLNKIDIDAILDSGYVEELIQDETYTPFPTVYNSERPDTIAGGLLEGRIAIIVDGSPFVLLVPALFVNFFQSAEDYFQRADFSTLIRLIRYLAFFLALLTPSAYIALTTYHQEMIPTSLLVSLSAQREGVPFPAFVEALLMEITFEILREAGVRLPKAVGSAISIVGALVLGQAAVEAGIVSSAMVIVVSLTAISSFVSPSFNFAISIRMLRFGFMILAATLGLFGILLGLIILTLHLASLRSFGVPYLTPMAPFIVSDQKDAILRFPRWKLTTRPRLVTQQNITREDVEAPKPPKRSRRKKRKKQK